MRVTKNDERWLVSLKWTVSRIWTVFSGLRKTVHFDTQREFNVWSKRQFSRAGRPSTLCSTFTHQKKLITLHCRQYDWNWVYQWFRFRIWICKCVGLSGELKDQMTFKKIRKLNIEGSALNLSITSFLNTFVFQRILPKKVLSIHSPFFCPSTNLSLNLHEIMIGNFPWNRYWFCELEIHGPHRKNWNVKWFDDCDPWNINTDLHNDFSWYYQFDPYKLWPHRFFALLVDLCVYPLEVHKYKKLIW